MLRTTKKRICRLAKEYGARNGVELFRQAVEHLSELEKYNLVYNRILL